MMNRQHRPSTLRRQFRFWSIHCLFNALPSLGIALFWLGLWRSLEAVAALFAAIATFVLLYTALTTFCEPLADSGNPLHLAMRLGTKARLWMALVSTALVPMGYTVMFTPDYWCGWLAVNSLNFLSRRFGSGGDFFTPELGEGAAASFFQVYVTTMTEGFILSGLLFLICFLALVALQMVIRNRTVPRDWLG